MDLDNFFFEKLYSIDFYESNNQKFFTDSFVEITIAAIIDDYFQNNPDIILNYVCDSVDFRQDFRKKLFDKWYKNASNLTYSKVNFEYSVEEENTKYHLSFIFKRQFYEIDRVVEKVNIQLEEFSNLK